MSRLERVHKQLRGVRKRFALVFIAFGLGGGTTFYYRTVVFTFILAPAEGRLSSSGLPIFTGPTDMLLLTFKTALMGGIVAALPMALFQMFMVARPFLSQKVQRFTMIFLPLGFIFFFLGVAFSYYVLLPTGLGFLLNFGTDIATPTIRITEYMELALAMMFWLGVIFELPLAMMLMSRMGVVTHTQFHRASKFVPPMAVIIAIVITPTSDLLNMAMVAIPIGVLWEVGVFLAWVARPREVA